MANRLANENSLYLKQHADNPVDWYPWGDEALERSRSEDKPLLVSIGYSACHWCHVMAHESFENDYIAGLMNKHFVCVKIDREERPDLDQIYMEAVQMIAQHGGWPLNVFCLPDGRPFFGGTYFPPEDRGNSMIPWPQLLMRIRDYYQRERKALEENAGSIVRNLEAMNTPVLDGRDALNEETLRNAAAGICKTHDDDFGGFGQAPKFPPSMTLDFLLELRRSLPDANDPLAKRIDQVVTTTLAGMAHGGLFDQVGGGFTRYSVDRYWLIPHFEKMLYDNGLLLDIFTKAWRRYRLPLYQAVAGETIAWAQREMLSPEGLFYSSLDADSEGREGKFYVWEPEEIIAVLGEEQGKAFCLAYNITPEGNFEEGYSNPALTAASFEERQKFAAARQKLLAAREKRPRPGRDEKRLLAWNALFVRGLAEAAFAFDRPEWFTMAVRAIDAIWEKMRFDENRLHPVLDNRPRLNGYLDDYAFLAEALLTAAAYAEFFEPGRSADFIAKAETIAAAVRRHFRDADGIGFFFTSDDHERLAARRKDWWDSALPAGNSALLHVFSSLHAITGRDEYRKELTRQRRAYPGLANRAPNGIVHALSAIAADTSGIAVLKIKGTVDIPALAELLRSRPWQRVFVLPSNDPGQPDGIQLCVGQTCHPAVKTPGELPAR